MEKFGIFELLDTLSAILGDGEDASSPAEEKSAPAEEHTDPTRPDAADAAFLPPAYDANGQATLSAFLDRHDAIARRVEKKKG